MSPNISFYRPEYIAITLDAIIVQMIQIYTPVIDVVKNSAIATSNIRIITVPITKINNPL